MTSGDEGGGDPTEAGGGGGLPTGSYQRVFRASPDGILVADRGGRIREVNPRITEIFGYERAELIGRAVEALVPESAREAHRGEREEYARDPEPRPMGVGRELEGRRADGTVVPVEISLSPVRVAGEDLVIATVRDLRRRERLREFGADALHAAEEERQRIARELHDDTAQRLAALLVRVKARSNRIQGEETEFLEELRRELLDVTEGVRRIARGLRPPALEDAGVAAALQSHVREVASDTEVDLELEVERVDPLLRPDARLALYRIAQEAVANALRHSGADQVRVRVRRDDGRVVLSVDDDGCGFRVPDAPEAEGRGLGILGMYERARGVGGALEIDSVPGEGTRVRAELPGDAG